MKDTVIKGSGNSRTIKSVPNLAATAPTYDKLLELLTGEGLPVDIGPLNPAGVDTMGTILDKASMLKDTTAALYGKGTDATPDDIFAVIRVLISTAQNTASGKGYVAAGSYVGTGKTKIDNPNSLTFSFVPKAVWIYADSPMIIVNRFSGLKIIPTSPLTTSYQQHFGFHDGSGSPDTYAKISNDGKTLYWYTTNTNAEAQVNVAGRTYFYLAFG